MEAQNFKPLTRLQVIQTEHFEVIFPAESELTARTLAFYADEVYEKISTLLDIHLARKIPVIITPHTDEFNGYMNPLPYPHIVLYDTPMSIEWTSFENSLKSLFTHELTHAVSLSTRGPFLEGLHKVFGGWVYPVALTAPMFMVEGVTVSFESLDGLGRANDPLIKEGLRQAIYEGSFLTPFQASGVYDLPPANLAYYYYGGLFSAYLQRTYGMEKYAELWQTMGKRYHFSLFFYNYGYFNIFQRVYGISFPAAWDNFQDDLRIENIENNDNGILRGGKSLINGIATGGKKVFVLDRIARGVISFDPASGKSDKVISSDSAGYALAASGDGERLLISSYRYQKKLAQAVVTEYYATGDKTGRKWEGLYGGRYFRDGVAGLSSSGYINNLVFRTQTGKPGSDREELLLRGSAELIYSHPCPINDTWIAFIVAKRGKRELGLYNYETKEVYRLGSPLEEGDDRWRYIRTLNFSEGHLLFGFNHDDRMYKLASVDVSGFIGETMPETAEAVFTDRDFSGGVFQPVMIDRTIYYRGAFATWDALMKYPEAGDLLSGLRITLAFYPWEEEYLAVAEPDRAPALPPLSEAKSRGYFSLKYLNPFKLWLPVPFIRLTGGGIGLDGGGIFSFISDPADTNWIILLANMDARFLMANLDIQWTNQSFGFPLTVQFADTVEMSRDYNFRRAEATITGVFTRGMGNERRKISLNAGAAMTLFAYDPGNGSSAYTWPQENLLFGAIAGLGFSTRHLFAWEQFGQGLSLTFNVRARFPLLKSPLRYEGIFQAAFEPYLPLQLTLYGILDANGMNLYGTSSHFGSTSFDRITPREYPTGGISRLMWLGGGEAEFKLFSMNIQDNLSHIFFNRIFSTLAYRGALYDSRDILAPQGNALGDTPYRLTQSLVLRFGGTLSTILITAQPMRISPYLWGAWKISSLQDGKLNNDFVFGFNFSIEM
ncbi:MAG: hypothetical protein LBT93_06885 [Treponema sp.]|nr:hypothetical protein [Treponema sp.]